MAKPLVPTSLSVSWFSNSVNKHYYQTRGGTCGHTLVCVRIKSSTTNTLQQSDAQWPLPFSHTVLLSLLPPLRLEKRHARARLAAEGGRLGEVQTGRKAEGRCGTQQCNRRSSAEGTLDGATSLLGSLTTATFGFHDSRKTLPYLPGFTDEIWGKRGDKIHS